MAQEAPRTKGYPVVGALPQILTNFPKLLQETAPALGDVVRIPVMNTDLYVLSHPDHIQYILRDNHKNYTRGGEGRTFLNRIIGRGILLLEGEEWLTQRRMMQPYFHRKYFPALIDTMVSTIDELLNELAQEANGDVIDFVPFIKRLTMMVFLRAMYSMALDRETSHRIGPAVDRAMRLGSRRDQWKALIPMSIKLPMDRQLEQAVKLLDEVTAKLIRERKALPEQPADLLGFLIEATDESSGQGMSNQQLLDECKTLLIGGYDTTSGTLMWTVQLLRDHPEMVQQLVDEANRVFSQPITYERVSELEYSRKVVMETLRLRPVTWTNFRVSVNDDEIGGYPIKGGSTMLMPVLHIQSDPRWWGADAAEFKPERWTDKNGGANHNWAFVPFGGGPRVCLGEHFALLEATLLVPKLLQRFEIVPVEAEPSKVNYAFFMQPIEMPVRVTRRGSVLPG
jgi:cytochrome P450